MSLLVSSIILCLFQLFVDSDGQTYVETINYRIYDTDGSLKIWKAGGENFTNLSCRTDENLSFIFTGWTENQNTTWLPSLVSNLKTYRGGCIVVADYWMYMDKTYGDAVSHYPGITSAIIDQVHTFQGANFMANKTLIFGFNLGGQIALGVGRSLAKKVARVDVCEPAGPSFSPSSKLSAENVQCIHTSSDKGTAKRDCHQDWNMGNCGKTQVAAGPVPMDSHGLCPFIYVNAFTNRFVAVAKPPTCFVTPYTTTWPTGFQMGYMETRFNYTGQFFAKTSATYPYN